MTISNTELYAAIKDSVNMYSVQFLNEEKEKLSELAVGGVVTRILTAPIIANKTSGQLLSGKIIYLRDPLGELILAVIPSALKLDDERQLSDIAVGSKIAARGRCIPKEQGSVNDVPNIFCSSIKILE